MRPGVRFCLCRFFLAAKQPAKAPPFPPRHWYPADYPQRGGRHNAPLRIDPDQVFVRPAGCNQSPFAQHAEGEMVMSKTLILGAAALALSAASASAQSPMPGYGYAAPAPVYNYSAQPTQQGTAQERAACRHDVSKFCRAELQRNPSDVLGVTGCLQANRTKLSRGCRSVLASHGQ
jgi:hypothetical protein